MGSYSMTDSALSWVLGDGCKTLRTPAEVRGRWSWVYDKLGGHEDGHGGVHLPTCLAVTCALRPAQPS